MTPSASPVPGRRRSIRDVAQLAGVSVGTVSHVLNDRDVVTPGTRAKVQRAIKELGFVRNESARQLRAGRSSTVGIVVLDVRNPFFTDVAEGADALVQERGGSVIICTSRQSATHEESLLRMLEEQRVMGVLLSPVVDGGDQLRTMVERGTHVVLVDRGDVATGLCSVSVDDVMGGRLALQHLLDLGHQSIAFVGGPADLTQVRHRLEGARVAIGRHEGDAVDLMVDETETMSVDEGRAAANRLLGRGRQAPTAIFCANDLLALGVLQEATRRGLRVPDDVAIVGYDDIDFAAAAAVPLTSVRQPRAELGRTAARLLVEEINDGDHHRHRQVSFSPDLIVRASTAGHPA
ncbi:MAG: LacI family DNA-binding transcriptional regulator [Terracoccus sp.]